MKKDSASKAREQISGSKRVVVKVGTRLLVSNTGRPEERRMKPLVRQIAAIHQSGREVVLVSSGAVGCGMEVLGAKSRPKNLPDLQMAAAVGQTRLMTLYEKFFSYEDINIGQVLLTHDDLDHRARHLNARSTLLNLLRHNIIPVVNENDAVSADEIKFGDNDMLAALVALLVGADTLVLLTTVNGFREPCAGGKTRRVPHLETVTKDVLSLASGKGSALSVGGMNTKLQAAQMATSAGCFAVIADGRKENALERVFAGKDYGTIVGSADSGSFRVTRHRKQWLAFFHRSSGSLVIDDGACVAIEKKGYSLLPIGITEVKGLFAVGSLVNIVSKDGRRIARGLVEYSSSEIEKIKGRKTSEIIAVLGTKDYDEVIHRDNMVILGQSLV